MGRGPHYTAIRNVPDYCGIGIYALVGSSGRVYIGSSINVQQRVMQHCYALREGRANWKIQQAFDSGETFTAKVLHYLPDGISRGELIDLEFRELKNAGGIKECFNNAYPSTHMPNDVLYSPVLTLSLDSGTIDRWKAAASAKGVSLEQFIQDAVETAIAAHEEGAKDE